MTKDKALKLALEALEDAHEALTAIKDALAQTAHQSGTDGWKLVPVDPTPAMWTAGGRAIKACGGHERDAASLAYAAMLSAAPSQPAQPAQEQDEDDGTVLVPIALLSAACGAIRLKKDAPRTLEQLRRYTSGADANISPALTPKGAGRIRLSKEAAELVRKYGSGNLPWVSLTEKDWQDAHSYAAKNCPSKDSVQCFAEAIEDKLKEKNGV